MDLLNESRQSGNGETAIMYQFSKSELKSSGDITNAYKAH